MHPQTEALAHLASYATEAIVLLAKCLEKNGALLPGQFEDAIRARLKHPLAAKDRFDLACLEQLLEALGGPYPGLH